MKKYFLFLISFLGLNKLFALVDLTCAQTIDLDPITPCDDTLYSYPVGIAVGKLGTSITVLVTSPVHTIPTPSEVSTAMGLSTDARILMIQPLHNGALVPENKVIQGPNDMPEKVAETMKLTADLMYLDDALIDQLRQLSIHKQLQLWYIDARGRWYGGATGYAASFVYNTLPEKAFGHATKAAIKIEAGWLVDNTKTFATAQDVAYLALQNS